MAKKKEPKAPAVDQATGKAKPTTLLTVRQVALNAGLLKGAHQDALEEGHQIRVSRLSSRAPTCGRERRSAW
jgi:hypothetical protein